MMINLRLKHLNIHILLTESTGVILAQAFGKTLIQMIKTGYKSLQFSI